MFYTRETICTHPCAKNIELGEGGVCVCDPDYNVHFHFGSRLNTKMLASDTKPGRISLVAFLLFTIKDESPAPITDQLVRCYNFSRKEKYS